MTNFLFEIKEGLLISLNAIRANKIRSILTTLGIVIGVTSVVLMSNAIKGIDKSFQDGISSFMGTDNLFIDRWAWFSNVPWWELNKRRPLEIEDYEKYKELAELPIAVSPVHDAGEVTVIKGNNSISSARVSGTNQDYIYTTNLEFAEGRFISELESENARRVIVLGYEYAEKLFPFGNALDQEVQLNGKNYKIIGILKKQGSFLMGAFDPDNQSFIPLNALFKDFQSRFGGSGITIVSRAPNNQMVPEVRDEAIEVMRRIRGLKHNEPDDFSINQQDAFLEMINQSVGVIQIAGLFITGLSLFVGAVGIMNIMFVSVKERTREIGIRKAIGAKKSVILRQFLAESAILCLLGGLIGLFFAIIGGKIIEQFNFPVDLQIDSIILAIGISLITGVLSGLAPAWTAAKMDPVDALRYE
ncbi:MAG: ABC transporter permease [Ignavibacteriae bacterium]|nr:ABC transporter permease [Ignavibacteriota bacterium]